MVMPLKTIENRSFLGVNLRRDKLDIDNLELVSAINADLHSMFGTVASRAGRQLLYSTAAAADVVRALAKVNGTRYQVTSSVWWREQASIATGLSSEPTSLMGYRPFGDNTIWAFLANQNTMKKDDGTNTYGWGIAAPTATPAVAIGGAGALTGDYMVKFTYLRKTSDGTVACESNPSPASAVQTLAGTALSVAGLAASTDAQVTHLRLYRTEAGGASFLFDQDIANGTTTASSTHADSALGSQVETDHDQPPAAGNVTLFNDVAWLCRDPDNPSYLWYSKRFLPEYVPTSQYLDIGTANDPVQCTVAYGGALGVFTRGTKYLVIGNLVSGFNAQLGVSPRGTLSPGAVISTEQGVIFPAHDGLFVTSLSGADVQLADDVLPLFLGQSVNGFLPINWDAADTMVGAYYKGRYFLAYPSGSSVTPDMVMVYSFTTKKFTFYDYAVSSFFYEEDTDLLTAGDSSGYVYELEQGHDDHGTAITMTAQTKDYWVSTPDTRELYQFFRVDADCGSSTLYVDFLVDGVSKGTYAITGSRTKQLQVLPGGSMGFTHAFQFSCTSSEAIAIYGISASAIGLGAA